MPRSETDPWFIGTYNLPTRTVGGKRRFAVSLREAEEILAGETLNGTPTATCTPTGAGCPVISDVAYNGYDLEFTVDVAGVAVGEYVLDFLAYTTGGAQLPPWGKLVVT